MLNITIDNPELEKNLQQTFGEDTKSIEKAFSDFIKQEKLKHDIGISIQQLEGGNGIDLGSALSDIKAKYE